MYRLLAATGILVASLFVALASLQGERRVIRVSAERFSFSPSAITMLAGEEVELRIRSDDTAHGFRIVGTDTNLTIPKRGQGEVTAVVRLDSPGRYTFECSRMCGAGHNFMRGELVVRERPAPTIAR
jgi:cytochrome c oxidase subunit 2